jgi:DNA invertase Pin-like site-specific DNA recombinase
MAQKEREFILKRQAEGIATAKAKGVRFGRPPQKRPDIYPELRDKWQRHEISARAAARELGITPRTFTLWVNEHEKNAGNTSAVSSTILNG